VGLLDKVRIKADGIQAKRPFLWGRFSQERRLGCAVVTMVTVVVVMRRGSERRGSKHHQEQGCHNEFLHTSESST